MKKVLAAILLMVYFTVSTGFVVCAHFCMNRFTSVELGSGNDKKCTQCGMHKKENGCCRDEVKVIKLEPTYTASQMISADFSLVAPLQVQILHPTIPIVSCATFDRKPDHGPPFTGSEICILHRVFRI
jgi:hypothetical protein